MQINITDIESNSAATANSINTRIGKIVSLVNGNIDATNIKAASVTKACLATDVLEAIYPVGSIYTNAQDNTNPGTLFGFGTWEAFGAGRVMVGIDEAQTEFDSIGETGGEKTHTLTIAELASHTHGYSVVRMNNTAPFGNNGRVAWEGEVEQARTTSSTGSGSAHNNLQPYVVVYMWKRVG